MDAEGRFLAVGHSIYYFAASVDAIASRKIVGIFSLHGLYINSDAAILQFKIGDLLKEFQPALLAQRLDHHSYFQTEFCARHWNKAAAPFRVFRTALGAHAFQRLHLSSTVTNDAYRQRLPYESH